MELRGDFKSYSEILDLLQIITMGKKSGEVNLRSDIQSITIFFKDGKAIDFSANVPALKVLRERTVSGEIPLNEAVDFLLHHIALWDKGRFLFLEKPISLEGIGNVDTLNIMMNFTKEEDELDQEVKEALKNNKVFTLSEEAKLPITITSQGWKLLVSICRGVPIWDALLMKGTSFSEDTKTLQVLFKHRMIKEKADEVKSLKTVEEKGKIPTSFVPEEKLEKIRELLVEAMGPMGEFLIEETLEELEINQLPTDLIPRFIDTILEKIPDTCLIEGEKCRDRLKEDFLQILEGGSDEA